jgi:protein-L-isoaspartate(D-aspartate) O-methyltransferase
MNKKELIRRLKKEGFPEHLLSAFEKVEREKFVPESLKNQTYEDTALPIGHQQTISQPYTIAFMLSLLKIQPDKPQKILEIGSGSGYVLALINELSPNSKIYGVERIKALAERSQKVLSDKKNIKILNKDGSKGLPGEAPFDRILVSAAFGESPQHLVRQLKVGGILVAPVQNKIVFMQRFRNETEVKEFGEFAFVPLIGG